MNYKEFKSAVKRCKAKHPVILLEGKRVVLPEDRERLVSLGEKLANDLPHCIFRPGNASRFSRLFSLPELIDTPG